MQAQTKPTKQIKLTKKATAMVAKKYSSELEYHQAYIDILSRLAGYRLSDMYVSILAYGSYYGSLGKTVKQQLADFNETSVQVISNGITKLRKLGLIEKNNVHRRLVPTNKEEIELTLVLKVGE
jgi:hypothetical protein